MKFDMHCHTKEGSPDGKVPVEEFIDILIENGYDGMLVTDHDSYNGYRAWRRNPVCQRKQDFTVLRGIEVAPRPIQSSLWASLPPKAGFPYSAAISCAYHQAENRPSQQCAGAFFLAL